MDASSTAIMVYRFSWVAGSAAVLLAVARMGRLLRPADVGPPWQVVLLSAALLGAVVTWTALAYRARWRIVTLVNLVGLAVVAVRLGAPDTTILGVIPTTATFSTMQRELSFALELIRFGTPPVVAVAGLLLILAVVFWVSGALLAWGMLRGHPVLALLPPLLFYLQLATIDRQPPGAWTIALLVVVGGSLAAVATDERLLGSGRLRGVPQPLPSRPPVALPASFLVAAVAMAIAATGLLAGRVPESGVLNWRARTGLGSGIYSGVSYNLFVGIQQSLVSRSTQPVFVARVLEGPVQQSDLYWKLIHLEDFNGTHWIPRAVPVRRPESGQPWENPEHAFQGPSVIVDQVVRIESLRQNYLPVLYSPLDLASDPDILERSFRVRDDGSIKFDALSFESLTYQIRSRVPVPDVAALATDPRQGTLSPIFQEAANRGAFTAEPRPVSGSTPEDISDFLELPDDLDPRIAELAGELTEGTTTPFEQALMLETFLRDPAQFTYSVDIDPGHSATNLADWLFEPESPNYRTGYCEQYSTAMGVMARALGIPSRVVLGFTPGEVTEDGLIIVRQRNAHSWVEAWMPGQGWVRFDPTPRSDGINPATVADVGFDLRAFIPEPTADASAEDDLAAGERPDLLSLLEEDPEFGAFPGVTAAEAQSRVVSPWLIAALAIPAVVLLAPLLKLVRRRRRLRRLRHGDITGAWEELVDRLRDLGFDVRTDLTPVEVAAATDRTIEPLASVHSEALYGARPPSPARVGDGAASFRAAERRLRTTHSAAARLWSWLRLGSLRGQ